MRCGIQPTPTRALVLALANGKVKSGEALARLEAVLTKYGDRSHLKKIVREAERMAMRERGGREVVLESARPMREKAVHEFRAAIREEDVIESKVNPELLAGVRLVIDGEWVIDATLAGKLKKLFRK